MLRPFSCNRWQEPVTQCSAPRWVRDGFFEFIELIESIGFIEFIGFVRSARFVEFIGLIGLIEFIGLDSFDLISGI